MQDEPLIPSQEANELFSDLLRRGEFWPGHENAERMKQSIARFEQQVRSDERGEAAGVAFAEAERHKKNSLEYEAEEDGGDGSKEQCLVAAITCMEIGGAIRSLGKEGNDLSLNGGQG